ncbi:MAG: prepilin-type N-terminal cleavage/methylation domain-containing protein [Terriglobia bacterium]
MTSDERHDNLFGFSLLEMMTVITLILILATFATPIYRTVIVRAREATLREDLFTLRSQIDRFTHDNECGPASLEELVDKGYMGVLPTDPFTGSNETWQVETQDAPLAVNDSAPAGIVDVHSGSEDVSLDGTAYSGW